METNNIETKPSIEQVLDNLDHNTVYKTKPSIVLSLVLIVLGIAAIMLNGQMPGASEGGLLSPLAIVVGILLLTWGIVAIFIRKTKYIYAPGKQPNPARHPGRTLNRRDAAEDQRRPFL